MNYSKEEVLQYIQEEDVKFIRLVFCDVFGRQKNLSIMADELPRAFERGIPFDPASISGFSQVTRSDLLLHPDPQTLTWLPWRPEHGKVVRMFCSITYPDGVSFPCDTRSLLEQAVNRGAEKGLTFSFATRQEFYLFQLDEHENPTHLPYDTAGYMDIAPEDRGENIRREIILTLEQMGIRPESSRHEAGPGQNTINFHYSDPLTAADHMLTFQTIVKTVARRNGLYADFSPRPLPNQPGNGLHITLSIDSPGAEQQIRPAAAGLLSHAKDMTLFLNPTEASYGRLGHFRAPFQISWSHENSSALLRVPVVPGDHPRVVLRSPDPEANPYLAFTLMIYAALDGIEKNTDLPDPHGDISNLPTSLKDARSLALSSEFIQAHIPAEILGVYPD